MYLLIIIILLYVDGAVTEVVVLICLHTCFGSEQSLLCIFEKHRDINNITNN